MKLTKAADTKMSSEQTTDPTAVGIPAAESEEALDIRSSMIMTQDWNLDVDSDELDDSPATVTDARQTFQNLVRSAIKYDTFKKGEADTVRRIIEHIELVSLKKSAEGFNRVNFSVGVLNCFFICWVLGAYPEHVWLLYLIESVYFIPRKFYNMWRAKPLNQAFYYLDFCWFTNFFAMAYFAIIVISGIFGFNDNIENGIREVIFKAALGVFCGVLVCANLALPFVACLFHDVNTMTGLFIHLMPPVVMYTFVWYNDRIVEAWPNLFNLSYLEDGLTYYGGTDSIASCSTAFYFTWWVIYVCFMLGGGGIDLPKKFKPDGSPANPRYDTVFHSTMRDGVCILIGKFFRGRSRAESLTLMETNMFDTIDFCLYMVFHMIASLSAIFVSGFLCFKSIIFFRLMLGASIVLAVVRGANRYTYYTTKMYSRVLRKEFAEQLAQSGSGGETKEGYTRLT
mmetsp:Transcript_23391/g.34923  ORF Transcript_23391/g.34923 Transcript_23391/m.34923 type:complete len:454 (+) Transcript_23391:87-1448(+)